MSLESMLRSVPEMRFFSPEQQEDLLYSFGPSRLRMRTLKSSMLRSMFVSYATGFIGSYLLPAGFTLAIIAGTILIGTPIGYAVIARQIRDEFRVLLQFLLTGQTLPACPRCGYELTGLDSYQCPECGADVKWKRPEGVKLPDEVDNPDESEHDHTLNRK